MGKEEQMRNNALIDGCLALNVEKAKEAIKGGASLDCGDIEGNSYKNPRQALLSMLSQDLIGKQQDDAFNYTLQTVRCIFALHKGEYSQASKNEVGRYILNTLTVWLSPNPQNATQKRKTRVEGVIQLALETIGVEFEKVDLTLGEAPSASERTRDFLSSLKPCAEDSVDIDSILKDFNSWCQGVVFESEDKVDPDSYRPRNYRSTEDIIDLFFVQRPLCHGYDLCDPDSYKQEITADALKTQFSKLFYGHIMNVSGQVIGSETCSAKKKLIEEYMPPNAQMEAVAGAALGVPLVGVPAGSDGKRLAAAAPAPASTRWD